MSGSNKNEWKSYLNGGNASFNFTYRDKIIPPPNPEPAPAPAPSPSPAPSQPPNNHQPQTPSPSPPNATAPMPKMKKNNNMKLNYKISGGKRKTKRASKKRRYSRRK